MEQNFFTRWRDRKRERRKRKISGAQRMVFDHISSLYGTTVAYGPLKGLDIGQHSWWPAADRTAKLLGTYERHVVDLIAGFNLPRALPFVDLGASDGYFAVGVLKAGLFDHTIAFEISKKGREALAKTAQLNGVEGQIDIRGLADNETLGVLTDSHSGGVMLIDIEGAEYDLLNAEALEKLQNFHIIVELHDVFMEGGDQLRSDLLSRTSLHFTHTIVRPGPVPVHGFRELDKFNDDFRYLAFSESRGCAMEWLVLTPK